MKLFEFLIFFIFCQSLLIVQAINTSIPPKSILEPNWDCFHIKSPVNHSLSHEFIRQLTLNSYWDVLKGSYKIGLLGNTSLEHHIHSLVSTIKKPISHIGKQLIIDQMVVDTNTIYMHMIISIQQLIHQITILTQQIQELQQLPQSQSLYTIFNASDSIASIESIHELQLQQQIQHISYNNLLHDYELLTQELNRTEYYIQQRYSIKHLAKQQLHQLQMNMFQNSQEQYQRLLLEKLHTLTTFIQQNAYQETLIQQLYLDVEINETMIQLENNLHLQKLLLNYSQTEELQKQVDYETYSLLLYDQKANIYQQNIETLIEVIYSDCLLYFTRLLIEDTWQFVLMLSIALLIITVYLLVIEGIHSLHYWFVYHVYRSEKLYSKLSYEPTWLRHRFPWVYTTQTQREEIKTLMQSSCFQPRQTNNILTCATTGNNSQSINFLASTELKLFQSLCLSSHLIVSSSELIDLYHIFMKYAYFYQQFSLHSSSNLQTFPYYQSNYLFSGPSGCGKSFTTKFLLNLCQGYYGHVLSYVVISGADLEALGLRASLYLHHLFQVHEQSNYPTIIILDEMDDFLMTRSQDILKPENEEISEEQPLLSTSTTSTSSNSATTPPSANSSADSSATNTLTTKKTTVYYPPNRVARNTMFALLEGLRQSSKKTSMILTTRLPLTQIDPAILDRMDQLISFSLPQPKERLLFLCDQCMELFQLYVSSEVMSQWKELLSNPTSQNTLLTSISWEKPLDLFHQHKEFSSLFQFPNDPETIPELDHQPSHKQHKSQKLNNNKLVLFQRSLLQICLQTNIHHFSTHEYNVFLCLQLFVLRSQGWSYRDLHKRLINIRYMLLSQHSNSASTSTPSANK